LDFPPLNFQQSSVMEVSVRYRKNIQSEPRREFILARQIPDSPSLLASLGR